MKRLRNAGRCAGRRRSTALHVVWRQSAGPPAEQRHWRVFAVLVLAPWHVRVLTLEWTALEHDGPNYLQLWVNGRGGSHLGAEGHALGVIDVKLDKRVTAAIQAPQEIRAIWCSGNALDYGPSFNMMAPFTSKCG